MRRIVFDMETGDPDDFLTLLLLLGHPEVELRAVTITPGSRFQVGLVRRALAWFGVDIPVGARNIAHPKTCVSEWHARAYGPIEPSDAAEPAADVLRTCCDDKTTLVTGAPLHNLGDAIKLAGFHVGRWVAQGGFAGEGVVPAERQLSKFRGLATCPTYNLNGNPKAALRALKYPGIGERYFVSKNVCHGVVYDNEFHDTVAAFTKESQSLRLIWKGMDVSLRRKGAMLSGERITYRTDAEVETDPVRLIGIDGTQLGIVSRAEALTQARAANCALVEVAPQACPVVCRLMPPRVTQAKQPCEPTGKKLHDPLAACCAIDSSIGTWAEVELYRSRGEWGSRLAHGTNTWIITDYDRDKFVEVFTAH